MRLKQEVLEAHRRCAEGSDCIEETMNSHRIILTKGMRCQIFILHRKLQVLGKVGI